MLYKLCIGPGSPDFNVNASVLLFEISKTFSGINIVLNLASSGLL